MTQVRQQARSGRRDAISSQVNGAGAVVIGRNEGDRLRKCLGSLSSQFDGIVYVDSGSTDDSVDFALRQGIATVRLDQSVPFSAARARNQGFERLRKISPQLEYVQFIDGDCELDPEWPTTAIDALADDSKLAAVCGRRRERFPDASVFNRLIDLEWDTPVGVTDSCGGDVLIRIEAFDEVGGYDAGVVAGEEPEMCFRLRRRGWTIKRLDAEMTRHDAAMHRFGQWWRRALRTGHAACDVWRRCGANRAAPFAQIVRSAIIWGGLWPLAAILAVIGATRVGESVWAYSPIALVVSAWWIQIARIAWKTRRRGLPAGLAMAYGVLLLVGKLAEFQGCLLSCWRTNRGRRSTIIEYK